MARILRRMNEDDQLTIVLKHALVDDGFLLANINPLGNSVLLLHPGLGLCIVTLHEDAVPPEVLPDGSVMGLPPSGSAAGVIASVKEQVGPAARPVPVAWVAWFPYLPPGGAPPGAALPVIHAGSDPEELAETIEAAMRAGSRPLAREEHESIESFLRAAPGAVPPRRPERRPAPVTMRRSAPPMPPSDPLLILLREAVRDAMGGVKDIYAKGLDLSLDDICAPHKFLPALLVVAADDWALTDLSTQDRGGFHVYLCSMPEGSWSGYGVADVRASSPLVLHLAVAALLRKMRKGDQAELGPLLHRYARFMEQNGHASIAINRIIMSISNEG